MADMCGMSPSEDFGRAASEEVLWSRTHGRAHALISWGEDPAGCADRTDRKMLEGLPMFGASDNDSLISVTLSVVVSIVVLVATAVV